MGQEIRGVPEAAALTGEADACAIGPYLARQRRLRGISLEDLSARTKIPRRSLERLEGGAFDRAVDGFTRGFVRTVAMALGLDADDAVARLLIEPPGDEGEDEYGSRQLRRAVALGAAAVLAAGTLALAFWGIRGAWQSEDPGASQAGVLYRRDPVRALFEGSESVAPRSYAESEPREDVDPAP
jgi:transcriptional regulator with XRE-family HTH domain